MWAAFGMPAAAARARWYAACSTLRLMTIFPPFDHAVDQSNRWLIDTMRALNTDDPYLAHRALRAVLHVVRDRLDIDEAAELGARMPLLIRGLYFDGWVPTSRPLRIRDRPSFLASVGRKLELRDEHEAERIVDAVFRVLDHHIAKVDLAEVIRTWPHELRWLWSGHAVGTPSASLGPG
jgi:uncharacterized protein (DUF2267 family)